MSEMFKRLDYIEDTTQDIKDNKVSNFSYTDAAYDDDNSAGVSEYSYTQEQNIPTKNHVELSQNVKDKGLRSQGASLPRETMNHFFGRVSYNLNKLTDFLSVFFRDVKRAFTQNGFRYSQYARYKKGDICHVLVIENGVELMKFYLRYSNAPEEITNIAVTNSSQWQLLYESDTYTQAEGDNSTKIASTAFVTRGLATLASSLNINVATKAPINHASSATTYGEASTTLYGHVKLTASIINSAALVATSQAIYTALSGKAPTSHASSATTYGAASTVNYGHAILDTEISTSTVRVPTSNVIRLAIAVVASSVSSLTTVVNGKAPLASPALTGTPTAPTQAAGNNSTRLATTAFVANAVSGDMNVVPNDYLTNGTANVVARCMYVKSFTSTVGAFISFCTPYSGQATLRATGASTGTGNVELHIMNTRTGAINSITFTSSSNTTKTVALSTFSAQDVLVFSITSKTGGAGSVRSFELLATTSVTQEKRTLASLGFSIYYR